MSDLGYEQTLHRHYARIRSRLIMPIIAEPAPLDLLARPGTAFVFAYVQLRHGVTRREMLADDRRVSVVHARAHLMELLYSHCGLTMPEIGRILDGRHHTTVASAIAKRRGQTNCRVATR